MTVQTEQTDGFFVEPWDVPEFIGADGFDFDAFMNWQPVERRLLPFIQPEPPRLTREHFPRPKRFGEWSRAEWFALYPATYVGSTVRTVRGLTTIRSVRREGDYVVLRGQFCTEIRVHRFAWLEG